jgi:sialic acid synthase SpsE
MSEMQPNTFNKFPPKIRAVLKNYGANMAFSNNDVYIKSHGPLLIMFSYIAVHPLIMVSIADTRKALKPKPQILTSLNKDSIVGTHLIEDGHYLFRGNIWVRKNDELEYEEFKNIVDCMLEEASAGVESIGYPEDSSSFQEKLNAAANSLRSFSRNQSM